MTSLSSTPNSFSLSKINYIIYTLFSLHHDDGMLCFCCLIFILFFLNWIYTLVWIWLLNTQIKQCPNYCQYLKKVVEKSRHSVSEYSVGMMINTYNCHWQYYKYWCLKEMEAEEALHTFVLFYMALLIIKEPIDIKMKFVDEPIFKIVLVFGPKRWCKW